MLIDSISPRMCNIAMHIFTKLLTGQFGDPASNFEPLQRLNLEIPIKKCKYCVI